MAWLYETENLNVLAANQKGLDFFGLESPQELENQGVAYVEKKKREQNPNIEIEFAKKVENELANTLSLERPQIFPSFKATIDKDGYCFVNIAVRTPVYENKKIKAILTINSDVTKYEQVSTLYDYYRNLYSKDIQTGNRLFMEYLGLPVYEFVLTTREIETLIALAKNHTHLDAARELDLAGGTMASYVCSIKHRLHNQNLNDILLHFTTNDKRKF
jgi:hypothetical protein